MYTYDIYIYIHIIHKGMYIYIYTKYILIPCIPYMPYV